MNKESYRWLMQQIKPARYLLSLTVFAGLLNTVFFVAQAAIFAYILQQCLIVSLQIKYLWLPLFMLVGLAILRSICVFAHKYFGFKAGVVIRLHIRQRLLDKLDELGAFGVQQQSTSEFSIVLVDHVEALQDFYALYFPQIMLSTLIPLALIFFVFFLNWVVALIFIVTAPLLLCFMVLTGSGAQKASRRNFIALERLGAFFLDRLQGIETLRFFRYVSQAQMALGVASTLLRKKTMEVLRIAFLSASILEFFTAISIALTAVYLGMSFLGYLKFGHYGAVLSLQMATFLLLITPEFYQPLRELGVYYHSKASAQAAAEKIMSILNQKTYSIAQGLLAFNTQQPINLSGKNISVFAPFSSNKLLDNINFNIKAGERVAVIGDSGAGKTTFLHMLMGLCPIVGDLLIDESILLKDLDITQWHRHIAWLAQKPLILAGSIFENIAFGRNISQQQAMDALCFVWGKDIVALLPKGINSLLLEGGKNISYGQAQRIALARALVSNSRLILLDEPTAGLDNKTELLIGQSLLQPNQPATVVIVTHQLHHIMLADRIILLDKGQVVTQGDPTILIKKDSYFQEFISKNEGNQ